MNDSKDIVKGIIPLTPKQAVLVLTAALIATAVALYFIKGTTFFGQKSTEPPKVLTQKETLTLLQKLAKHVVLPIDEMPTIATVSNVDKLKNQQFFALAQNGDRVIIYTNTKKAYLYRESIDKVINIGPVNFPTPTALVKVLDKSATESGQLKTSRIALYNGTKNPTLTASMQNKLFKDANLHIILSQEKKANRTDYPQTLIIDFTGGNADLVDKLIDLVKGTVSKLPAGEHIPDADVLIIIGDDFARELKKP